MKLVYAPHLSDHQVRLCQTFSHAQWGGDKNLEERLESLQELLEAGGNHYLTLAGLVDDLGHPICSLKRYHLQLSAGAEVIPTVGLGAIFTHKDHRHKGYASELIKCVLDEARASGKEAALLYTDIGEDYYAKRGFKAFPTLKFKIPLDKITPGPALDWRPALVEEESKLLHWYHESFPNSALCPYRDIMTWKFYRKRNQQGPDCILMEEGREVGYFSASGNKGRLWIDELILPSAAGPLRMKALRTLSECARNLRAVTLEGWARPFDIYPLETLWERPLKPIPMVCALKDGKFRTQLENYSPELAHFGSLDYF